MLVQVVVCQSLYIYIYLYFIDIHALPLLQISWRLTMDILNLKVRSRVVQSLCGFVRGEKEISKAALGDDSGGGGRGGYPDTELNYFY